MHILIRCRKASSFVYAVLLLVMMTFVLVVVFLGFVVSKVDLARNVFGSQMPALLLQSFALHDAHITKWLRNAEKALVEITAASVDGLAATPTGATCTEPGSIEVAQIKEFFIKGAHSL